MAQRGLLAHLSSFFPHPEDLATESLTFLLRACPAARGESRIQSLRGEMVLRLVAAPTEVPEAHVGRILPSGVG